MILLNDKGVAVAADVLSLTPHGAASARGFDQFHTTANSVLADVPTPPGFEPGRFTMKNGALVADAEKALELRASGVAAAWESIKHERERRKAGGVDAGGSWFHSDEPSRTQYAMLDIKALRANLPGTTVLHPEWKTMTGAKVPMTVNLLRQIIDNGITKEQAIFVKAEQHRAAMEASTDPLAYDFSAGWPSTYGE